MHKINRICGERFQMSIEQDRDMWLSKHFNMFMNKPIRNPCDACDDRVLLIEMWTYVFLMTQIM